jgi:hypothetical protein
LYYDSTIARTDQSAADETSTARLDRLLAVIERLLGPTP